MVVIKSMTHIIKGLFFLIPFLFTRLISADQLEIFWVEISNEDVCQQAAMSNEIPKGKSVKILSKGKMGILENQAFSMLREDQEYSLQVKGKLKPVVGQPQQKSLAIKVQVSKSNKDKGEAYTEIVLSYDEPIFISGFCTDVELENTLISDLLYVKLTQPAGNN